MYVTQPITLAGLDLARMAVTEAEWAEQGGKTVLPFEYGDQFIRRHSVSARQQDRAMLWFIRMATERDW